MRENISSGGLGGIGVSTVNGENDTDHGIERSNLHVLIMLLQS